MKLARTVALSIKIRFCLFIQKIDVIVILFSIDANNLVLHYYSYAGVAKIYDFVIELLISRYFLIVTKDLLILF